MGLPEVVSRDEWVRARKVLLTQEKELTRKRDALSTARRELPMVKIEKDYRFEGPDGPVSLLDLFDLSFKRYVTPLIVKITWVLTLTLAGLWLTVTVVLMCLAN